MIDYFYWGTVNNSLPNEMKQRHILSLTCTVSTPVKPNGREEIKVNVFEAYWLSKGELDCLAIHSARSLPPPPPPNSNPTTPPTPPHPQLPLHLLPTPPPHPLKSKKTV